MHLMCLAIWHSHPSWTLDWHCSDTDVRKREFTVVQSNQRDVDGKCLVVLSMQLENVSVCVGEGAYLRDEVTSLPTAH